MLKIKRVILNFFSKIECRPLSFCYLCKNEKMPTYKLTKYHLVEFQCSCNRRVLIHVKTLPDIGIYRKPSMRLHFPLTGNTYIMGLHSTQIAL